MWRCTFPCDTACHRGRRGTIADLLMGSVIHLGGARVGCTRSIPIGLMAHIPLGEATAEEQLVCRKHRPPARQVHVPFTNQS